MIYHKSSTMTGAILQSTPEFQILQFIIHANGRRCRPLLGATMVKHTCAQPDFRQRAHGIVASPHQGYLHRFESLDTGQLGEQLGIQKGDVYLVYRAGGWDWGTLEDLKQDLDAGRDFALNVLRDLWPDDHHHDDDACGENDLMEETLTEKTEQSLKHQAVAKTASVSKTRTASSNPSKRQRAEKDVREQDQDDNDDNDDDDDEDVLANEIEADIPGYRVLEHVVKGHYKIPLQADFVEQDCTDDWRNLVSDFLDSSEPYRKYVKLQNVSQQGILYKAGVRDNDVLLRFFKNKWYFGKKDHVEHRLKFDRNFLMHVLRENATGMNAQAKESFTGKQSAQPEIIEVESSDDEQSDEGRRKSPPLAKDLPSSRRSDTSRKRTTKATDTDSGNEKETSKITKPTVVLQTSGYEILKGHVRDKASPFGAQLEEQECPADFLSDLSGFFPAGSFRRCRFVKVQKGSKADQLGIRNDDIFLHFFKNAWFLGTLEDFDRKAKKNRGFFVFFMRKQERKYTETLGSPASSVGLGKRSRDSQTDSVQEHSSRRRSPRVSRTSFEMATQVSEVKDSDRVERAEHDSDSIEVASASVLNAKSGTKTEKVGQSPARAERTKPKSVDESLQELNMVELSQLLVYPERGTEKQEVLKLIEESLGTDEIEKFVCVGGLCHVFGLLKHSDEDVQTMGWKIVLSAHSQMPQCYASLLDLGLYARIIQSLQGCQTTQLFETLVNVLVSPMLGTGSYLRDFVALDGAVPSVMMAIDRQLGSTQSYISCCRFLANVMASRDSTS